MKQLLFGLLLLSAFSSCVQKAHQRVVVYTLTVAPGTSVQSAGIRGGDAPLHWDRDFPMQAVLKDSVYRATVVSYNGYAKTEVKFTVNDQFELQEKPNRIVRFAPTGDTTFVQAQFDVVPQEAFLAPAITKEELAATDNLLLIHLLKM
jgi:putative oxidoreductase